MLTLFLSVVLMIPSSIDILSTAAIAEIQTAQDQMSEKTFVAIESAKKWIERGNLEQAERSAKAGIGFASQVTGGSTRLASFVLGEVHLKQGRFGEALDELSEAAQSSAPIRWKMDAVLAALATHHEHGAGRMLASFVMSRLGIIADGCLESRLLPDYLLTSGYEADALLIRGGDPEASPVLAEKDLQDARRLFPDNPATNFVLGRFYVTHKEPKKAVPYLQLASTCRAAYGAKMVASALAYLRQPPTKANGKSY